MTNLPIPENEKERLRALKNFHILDTQPEEEFDRLTKMASIVCGTPISLITLLDEERQWFKSNVGIDISEGPRRDSFCQYALMEDALMEIKDTWEDERFVDNPLVTGPPNMRYYAGYPLIDPDGHALGALCVIDREPKELDSSQQKILTLLAREAVSQIMARKEKILLKNYEKLFLESIDMIAVAGSDGYFRKINPAFRRTLGWSEKELLNMPFYSFIHPDDVEPTREFVYGLTRGEKILNFTNRCRTIEGTYRNLHWIATPDTENDNLYAIGRDITEYIQIQNELLQVSDFHKKILNGTTYTIISTDTTGMITTFNRGAEIMLGYDASEIVNKMNLVDFIHGAASQTGKEKGERTGNRVDFGTLVNQANTTDSDANAWTFIKKNGTPLVVELTISQLESDGKDTTGYLAVGKDITSRNAALKQLEISERRHRAFFENSQSLMCTHDLAGNFLSINPAGVEMMGYTFGEIMIRSLYDIVAPQYQNDIDTYLREITQNGSLKGLMQILDKEGEKRTWMYNNVLSEFADGRKYVIGNAVDLTSRIMMEHELMKAKETAEQNARAKDIFLANMSHEIRTPMNAIMGFANLLKYTPMTEEQQEYAHNIGTASENLLGIINDILDLSKIESGHLTIEEIPFSLNELIKNIKAVQQQKAAEKGLKLDVFMGDSVPDFMLGDPTRLTQILLNLVSNALKFTEKGSVRVLVELKEESPSGHVIQFSVSDTGIGIPEDKLGTIFERFVQADTDTTRKYGGTGLGLSISKLLIELQKGSISVDSSLNSGSTFTFTLPFRKAAKPLLNRIESSSARPMSTQRLKVLLVEDNILNQRLATRVLENLGFEPDLAENGRIATEKVAQNAYNVILMDLQMPEMDGYQATRFIRNELKSTVPIIAMTAHSLVGERDKCLLLGMDEYIPKPFSPSDLFNKITALATPFETPSTETSASSLVDLTYLHEISDQNKEFEQEMIQLFIQQAPGELVSMKSAIELANHKAISEIAHKLKSSYSLLGIQENGLLKQLEQQGANATPTAEITPCYEELVVITEKAIEELKGML
jgi:PAS domain S-box-containing protein